MKRKAPGTMSYEFISVDRAKKLLQKNIGNRPFQGRLKALARKYAADIANGDWNESTSASITIAADGNLCDGQTRLNAIIMAGKGIYSFVYYINESTSAMNMIGYDDAGIRQLFDHQEGTKFATSVASCMCSSMRFMYGHHLSTPQKLLVMRAFEKELIEIQQYPRGKMKGTYTSTVASGFLISMAVNPGQSSQIAEQFSKLTSAEEGRWKSVVSLQHWLNVDGNGSDSGLRDRRTSLAMICSDPKNRNRKQFEDEEITSVKDRNKIVVDICQSRGFYLPKSLKAEAA